MVVMMFIYLTGIVIEILLRLQMGTKGWNASYVRRKGRMDQSIKVVLRRRPVRRT
jgi:hypothetical protein